MKKQIRATIVVTTLAACLVGCNKSQTENAVEKTKDAAAKTGGAIETAAEKTGDALETAVQKTGEAIETGAKKTQEGVEKAVEKVKKATE